MQWENAVTRDWAEASTRFGVTERHRFTGLPVVELSGGLLVVRAVTPEAKRHALRGLATLDATHAIQVPTSAYEHTFGMRFAIDLIWLDGNEGVVRVDRDVPPRRVRTCAEAGSVVETVAGQAGTFIAAGLGSSAHASGPPAATPRWAQTGGWRGVFRTTRD
jgi:uncharacterized protein